MKNKKIKTILFSFFLVLFCSPVYAAGLGDAFDTSEEGALGNVAGGAGYNTEQTGVNPIIETVIQVALSFLGVIFLVLTIYGGFLWMTARGNEEQVTKAKNLLRSAVIGLIVVVAAYAISWFVMSQLAERTLEDPEGSSEDESAQNLMVERDYC